MLLLPLHYKDALRTVLVILVLECFYGKPHTPQTLIPDYYEDDSFAGIGFAGFRFFSSWGLRFEAWG